MDIHIETLVVGPLAVNCYLAWDAATRDAVIIDPGADEAAIAQLVNKAGCTPRGILLTHGHGDHIGAVEAVKQAYNVPLYAGKGESKMLTNPVANLSAFVGTPVASPAADKTVEDEDLLVLGSLHFLVLATPGHSPGGVCYLQQETGSLFCGDTLFQGSIGRTDFPGCSYEALMESIRTKILTLPDAVVCYPGHGPLTTVGAERRSNPFLIGEQFA